MREIKNEKIRALRDKMLMLTYENPVNRFIGIEVLELNEHYGKTRVRFCDEICNPYGTVHGGILSALADATAGTAACMCGSYVTTVSATLNFLLPAEHTEYIYCEAMQLKTGRHISVFDIRITDDAGTLLDSGEYNFFISKKKVI